MKAICSDTTYYKSGYIQILRYEITREYYVILRNHAGILRHAKPPPYHAGILRHAKPSRGNITSR